MGSTTINRNSSGVQLKYLALTIWLLIGLCCCSANAHNHEEQECPEDCHCHYSRINWITDCSESNLTRIPHDNLSMYVYVLDMNDNDIDYVDQFPKDIHLRRFQIAHNRLTELKHESFSGLKYLLDADFSFNDIKYIDPKTFR